MVQSKAGSVAQYLKELEPERRAVIESGESVRARESFKKGFKR